MECSSLSKSKECEFGILFRVKVALHVVLLTLQKCIAFHCNEHEVEPLQEQSSKVRLLSARSLFPCSVQCVEQYGSKFLYWLTVT